MTDKIVFDAFRFWNNTLPKVKIEEKKTIPNKYFSV
jgi:hypothetical protein